MTGCRLWRGAGPLDAAAAQVVQQATSGAADPPPLPDRLVVEVLLERGAWLVLLSTQAPGDAAQRVLIALGERAARIDRLRELGFTAAEARIDVHDDGQGGLRVEVLDPQCVTGEPQCWVRVHGVRLLAPQVPDEPGPWLQQHRHAMAAPAPEDPVRLVEREVCVVSTRRRRRRLNVPAQVELLSLGVVEGGALLRPWPLPQAWCERLDVPASWLAPHAGPGPDPALAQAGAVRRAARAPLLQACGYRFTNVEIVGFRIDLSQRDDVDATLAAMVEPLNFHHQARVSAWGAQAFRWRPAARVLVVELLRYGRMYWGEQAPTPDEPWTAQHELLLRVLVGRVDDASSQARDPALFVPAIFVDNPWSRWIGRELQGFPKQLARFYGDAGPLDLSGHLCGQARPLPITQVTQVRLRPTFGLRHDSAGTQVLGIELPPGADDPALWADVRLLMGHAGLRDARWRQGDFVDSAFRRGFAAQALGLDPARMPSVQVSPVDARALPRAWVEGTMLFDRMEAGVPDGVARLHLPRPSAALPPAWAALSRLFPERVIALPTGSWYRARADLRMQTGPGRDG